MEKNNNKKFLIGALAVLLVAVAVGGTIAWLNAQSQLTNSFTVGNITDPTTDPKDPDQPITGDENLSGNLYEPSWVDGAKLVPGTAVAKDPMVGVGAGSENAYVFIYVVNKAAAEGQTEADVAPYFTLDANWDAVEGKATVTTFEGAPEDSYTSGLFVYGTEEAPRQLVSVDSEDDVWTSAAFNTVTPPSNINADAFAQDPSIVVYSYVVAADSPANALADAKAWVDTLARP